MGRSYQVARHPEGRSGRNTIDSRNILKSTYGLDCLTVHAKIKPSQAFRGWIWHVFGEDIPGEAIDRLYGELNRRRFQDARNYDRSSDPFPHPFIYLDPDLERYACHSRGAFNDVKIVGAYHDREIFVDASLVLEAYADDDRRLVLLAALVEEFGHHVDHVLRNEYTNRDLHPAVSRDAPLDEGAVFAMTIVPVNDSGLRGFEFAYDIDDRPFRLDDLPLQSRWGLLFPQQRLAEDRQERSPGLRAVEFFAAADTELDRSGRVHFYGHHGIERVALSRLGWSSDTQKFVYFGNWQRDYSQVVDPKILQGMSWAHSNGRDLVQLLHSFTQTSLALDGSGDLLQLVYQAACQPREEVGAQRGTSTQWENPAQHVPYAWLLPALVDVLAEDHFGREFTVVDSPRMSYSFGVYAPHEHIDNPCTIETDFRSLDQRFRGRYSRVPEGEVESDGRSLRYGLLKYIQQSVDFAKAQITLASGQPAPRTAFGVSAEHIKCMHLGSALHTIEDFYAHSNFLELLLRSRGFRVDTYGRPVISSPFAGQQEALVTGAFGGIDTAMSIVGIVFHHMATAELELQPGPSKVNRMLAILIDRYCAPAAPLYNLMLDAQQWVRLPGRLKRLIVEGYKSLLRHIRVEVAWSGAELMLELIIPPYCRIMGGSSAQRARALEAADGRDVDALLDELMAIARLNAADRRIVRGAAQFVDMNHHGDVGLHAHPRDPEKVAEVLEELAGLYQRIKAADGENPPPTHTQLGKDHATHPLHLLAAECAIWAVGKVGRPMATVWDRGASPDRIAGVHAVVDRLMRHPMRYETDDRDEIDRILTNWLASNSATVDRLVRAHDEGPLAIASLEGKRRFLINLRLALTNLIRQVRTP